MSPDTQQRGVPLEVRGLHKAYKQEHVLKGIDLQVGAGEVFVIMGPSGSGKSVLLRQLIGLEQPDKGEVRIAGEQVRSPELMEHVQVAMVFQSGALLNSLTVGENVGLYLTESLRRPVDEVARRVAETLAVVGLAGTEGKLPSELSGGMKKRVALARALVMEPQLILYDEPTSELDPVSAVLIGEEIAQLNRRIGVTSVVVTHDRSLAFGIGSRIGLMESGQLLAVGTPEEIRRSAVPGVQKFLNATLDPGEAANRGLRAAPSTAQNSALDRPASGPNVT
jgi:phospholipid/cholesterol/gamma-HCH transport system ATP-binding protein